MIAVVQKMNKEIANVSEKKERADKANKSKGIVENPVYIEGKPYAYNRRGKLVMIEDFNPETMERYTLTKDTKATPEQIEEIKEARRRGVIFDEDCPPTTPEMRARVKKFWGAYD